MSGGALKLLLANVWHGTTGFVIYVAAARLLDKVEFGRLTVAMALALAVEELVKLGWPKAVSREVARSVSKERAVAAVRLGMRWNLLAALLLAGAFALASPALAKLLADPEMALLMALGGLDMVLFAPYTIRLAALNGRRRFGSQAALMASYSTVKLASLLGALALGGTALAGVWGYLIGSSMGSLIALFWSGAGGDGEADADASPSAAPEKPLQAWAMLGFSAPMALFGFLLAAFLNMDLLAFEALASRTARWLDWGGAELLGDAARREAGHYAGATHVSRMVFFVFLAFGEALFPSMARALAHEAPQMGAGRLKKGLGEPLLLMLPALGLGMATGAETAAILFGPGYERAGQYLNWLLPLTGALVVFHVLGSALAAANRPWSVFLAAAAGLALNVGLNFFGAVNEPLDPPRNALLASGIMLACLAPSLLREFGLRWIPWLEIAVGLAGAWLMSRLGLAIRGQGWLMFLWGGLAFGGVWAASEALCRIARKKLGEAPGEDISPKNS